MGKQTARKREKYPDGYWLNIVMNFLRLVLVVLELIIKHFNAR